MAQQALVTVVTNNPNDQIGGGGCLCGETKRPGCVGPYAVFPASESASNISPHVVACRRCLQEALLDLEGELSTPTTDKILIGGQVMSNDPNGRFAGQGPRDEGYIPVDGEDAKKLRDGSPGFNDGNVGADLPDPAVAAPTTPDPERTAGSLSDVAASGPAPVVEPAPVVDEPRNGSEVVPETVVAPEAPSAASVLPEPVPGETSEPAPPQPVVAHPAVEQVQDGDHTDVVIHDAASVEQKDGDVIVHETQHHDDWSL